jgi:hypothetical protein
LDHVLAVERSSQLQELSKMPRWEVFAVGERGKRRCAPWARLARGRDDRVSGRDQLSWRYSMPARFGLGDKRKKRIDLRAIRTMEHLWHVSCRKEGCARPAEGVQEYPRSGGSIQIEYDCTQEGRSETLLLKEPAMDWRMRIAVRHDKTRELAGPVFDRKPPFQRSVVPV